MKSINIGIIGTGSYVPDNVVTNKDLENLVDTTDEWIRSRTGIESRHISNNDSSATLAIKAAKKALINSNTNAEDIDLIIVATITPNYFTPSTACIVQKEIKATNATCFDISAACSGFVYALSTAYKYLLSGLYKKALVIGTEVLSKIVNWEDRNTCVLFGDGSGAIVLGEKESGILLGEELKADGLKGDLLKVNAISNELDYKYIQMEGREVYKFATRTVANSILRVLEKSNLSTGAIQHYILHQANYRIIQSVIKKLKEPLDKFFINLNKYGNTSSASIPIALDEMNMKNLIKPGEKIILSGFGGGLTWATVLLQW